jgi:hypothetical protein
MTDNIANEQLAQQYDRTKETIRLADHDAPAAGTTETSGQLRLRKRDAEWNLAQHMLALLKRRNRLCRMNAVRRSNEDRIDVICTNDLIHRIVGPCDSVGLCKCDSRLVAGSGDRH